MPIESNSSSVRTTAAQQTVLLCRVGSVTCGVPLEHVSETMRPLPLQTFRGMPAFVAGLSIIRGAPVPVVDLGRLLGHEDSAPRARLIVAKAQDRRFALMVEQVVGVRTLNLETSALPPLLGDEAADMVAAVGAIDARLLVVLRSSRLLDESLWNLIASRGDEA